MLAGGAVKTDSPTETRARIPIQNLQSPDNDLISGKAFVTVDPTFVIFLVALLAACIAVISASLL